MSEEPSRIEPYVVDQLVVAVKLVVSWLSGLSSTVATQTNMEAIRNFRAVVIRHIDNLPTKKDKAMVKRYLKPIGPVLQRFKNALVTKKTEMEPSLRALRLAESLRALSSEDRAARLDDLIALITSAFDGAATQIIIKDAARLNTPVKLAIKGILMWPIPVAKLELYQQFVDSIQRFSMRVPSSKGTHSGLLRLSDPLREVLQQARSRPATTTHVVSEKREELTAFPASKNRAHDDALVAITASNAVSEALEQLTSRQSNNMPTVKLDKVIETIGGILNDFCSNSAWDPRTDERVLKCVARLRVCVDRIQQDDPRAKRVAILAAWGIGRSAG